MSGAQRQFFGMLLGGWRRPMRPAPKKPDPATWDARKLTVAWLGHSTVLLNFCGVHVLTDPALYPRVGLGWGPFILGPKRHVAPALRVSELPRIDLVLLSHAHMDHLDRRTLGRLGKTPAFVTAPGTADLLRRPAQELRWGERFEFTTAVGTLEIEAVEVKHWGARLRTDTYRGFNGYILRRNGLAVLFAGDTAYTPAFGRLRAKGPFDLAIFPIGAYDPWITSHCNPEQAVAMAGDARARLILPVHHQTFQLSLEPMDEPVRRFRKTLAAHPERDAALPIGGTLRVGPQVLR